MTTKVPIFWFTLKLFAKFQEATSKAVKQALGVLQAPWGIIKGPDSMWKPLARHLMMNSFIIFHNMIIQGKDKEAQMMEGCPRPLPLLELL